MYACSFPTLMAQLPVQLRAPMYEFALTAMFVSENAYKKAVSAGKIQGQNQNREAFRSVIAHYQKGQGVDALVQATALQLAQAGSFVVARAAQCAWDRKKSTGEADLNQDLDTFIGL